jgi:hypothetical protein
MHRKSILPALAAALLGVIAVQPAEAQQDGGSSYSIFNLGDIRQAVTASGVARGGSEVAVTSPRTINGTNPALWGDLETVSVQAGMSFAQYQVSDDNSSLYQNRTSLQNFSAGFPMSDVYNSALVLSIRPYSTVNYLTQLASRVPTAAGDTADGTISYSGDGGISEATFGASFAPIPEVTIGVAGSRFFGAIRNSSGVSFPDGSLNPAVYQRNDVFGGWGFRAGLAARPIEGLTIGGVFESGSNLNRERHDIAAYVDRSPQGSEEVVDTTASDTQTVKLAPRITAGASYRTGRALLSTQVTMQAWSADDFANARNSMRIALGFDRMGNEAAGASGFDRWTLRAGAYMDQTYFNVRGTGIDEVGVSIGAGIPLTFVSRLNVGTTLDLAIEAGQRGSTDNGLTKELFGRFNLELTLGELWFIRSRR